MSIDPGVLGFGFTYFESPQDLIDWSVPTARFSVSVLTKRKIIRLITDLNPDVVVCERADSTNRSKRIRLLLADLVAYCKSQQIDCVQYSRSDVRDAFRDFGIYTKADIANKLTEYFPELERMLPPKRKARMSEDPRYGIFDAAALAFTYYAAH